tara:strand:- start:153 stop:290 length:138 start_codon:yes stop_codon:yes gene_type:complete
MDVDIDLFGKKWAAGIMRSNCERDMIIMWMTLDNTGERKDIHAKQ